MLVIAHATDLLEETATNIWDWSSPLGLGTFIVGVALALALLAWTVKTLSEITPPPSRKK